MVSAPVEVWMRKPKVGDFDSLRVDATSVRGWWRNRVTRTLLVFILSSIGASIGAFVAGYQIYEKISI
jgi:pheromone shutdown protein TraB